MPTVSVTDNYDALLSTTLRNASTQFPDQISSGNKLLYHLKKRKSGSGYKVTSDIGYQIAVPLMTGLGTADSYSKYDQLDTTPVEGITTAFYDWRLASVPVTISGEEELKNSGENRLLNLLEAKKTQAMLTMEDYVGRAILQGNGQAVAAQIRTPKTSTANGSVFIDPLPKLVDVDNDRSVAVGSINPVTAGNEFWRNVAVSHTGSTFVSILKDIDNTWNSCSKGVGGSPDLCITEQQTFEEYAAALRVNQRVMGWQKADLPWDALSLHGAALVWDEFTPNGEGDTTTISTTAGTIWFLNTEFIEFRVASGRNFDTTPFVTPENQDAKTALIRVMCSLTLSARRKQGVLYGIDTTIVS